MSATPFADLNALAAHLRQELQNKKFILALRLQWHGQDAPFNGLQGPGKQGDERDTLYFNAFTEDLFYWDNDLEDDSERC